MTRSSHLVCVIDDEDSIRRGLSRLLTAASYIAESYPSASTYLTRPTYEGPVCLILDVRMPQMNGLVLQEMLAARQSHEEIVFISGHSDIVTCAQAMRSGAVDFLPKPFTDDELIVAVERALDRSATRWNAHAESAALRAQLDTLTSRELEVMRFVVGGLLNKQIAAEIGTVEKTVKVHRGRVMEKLQMESVADLVRFAERAHVAPLFSSARTKVQ
jgi:FixJ family two-component response regulator